MKGTACVLVLLVLAAAGGADARKAFRAGKRVEAVAMDEPVIAGSSQDEEGNENVELIPNPDAPKAAPCKDVDCAKAMDDGGVLQASLSQARTDVSAIYDAMTQTAPVVATKGFCSGVLAAIKAKKEPYWNSETSMCNAEREHLLAQCEKRVEGFIAKVAALCPNADNKFDAAESALNRDFKKVTYVEKIPDKFTGKPPADKSPCPDGQKPCKKLAWTKDGKPKEEWAAFPGAPDAAVDAHVIERQSKKQ